MTGITDMHCDTLMKAFFEEGPSSDVFDTKYTHLNVLDLKNANSIAQFFAVFIPPEDYYREYLKRKPLTPDEYIDGCVQIFNNTVERHSDVIRRACNADEIEANMRDGKLSAVLTMEDGVAVYGDMKKLDSFYERGFRAIALTWNFANCFGYPNSRDPELMAKGLTDFGKEAVVHMQDLGILVDVSHLSDGGFWDIVKLAKVPFIASHSNARTVCGHPRNMTDDMILALKDKGGIMGLNLSPMFLSNAEMERDREARDSRISDMADMMEYEKRLAGIEVMAIGTDLDGIGGNLEVGCMSDLHKLFDELIRRGFTTEDIDRIAYKNALRVFREAMH
ncbi:MAG: dipeptidase [Solobacterium sp.]|nr:dipeptidase [Solobacterium sp.]